MHSSGGRVGGRFLSLLGGRGFVGLRAQIIFPFSLTPHVWLLRQLSYLSLHLSRIKWHSYSYFLCHCLHKAFWYHLLCFAKTLTVIQFNCVIPRICVNTTGCFIFPFFVVPMNLKFYKNFFLVVLFSGERTD